MSTAYGHDSSMVRTGLTEWCRSSLLSSAVLYLNVYCNHVANVSNVVEGITKKIASDYNCDCLQSLEN